MNSSKLKTIEQIREFLSGTETMEFSVESTEGCYAFIQNTLDKFGYGRFGKADKGLIRRYLRKMTGYSRAQLARLIADHRKRRRLGRRPRPRSRFPKRYLDADIGLLAHTAGQLHKARQQLFKQIHEQSSHSPGSRRPQLSLEASTLSP